MAARIVAAMLMMGLLAGCGGEEPAEAGSPAPAAQPEAPASEAMDAPPKDASPEELYANGFEEAFASIEECKGLDKAGVKAFHERRNAGLDGQVLSGDDNAYLYCDYKIRLLVEGRTEYQGL